MELSPGAAFPDLDLPDHTGRQRRLSELAGGDPTVLLSSRGWWCPKEQRYMRELCRMQDEFPGTVIATDDFCEVPPPPGPVIERYAGVPWPGGQF
jgi:hypothetical protein